MTHLNLINVIKSMFHQKKTHSPICLSSFFKSEPYTITLPEDHTAFNPSIINIPSGFRLVVRANSVNKTLNPNLSIQLQENWIITLGHDFSIQSKELLTLNGALKPIDSAPCGLEDGRLFTWRGSEWILFTGLEINNNNDFSNTMILCKLNGNEIIEYKEIRSPFNLSREKNWMPWVQEDELFFVYSMRPFDVFKFQEGKLRRISVSSTKSRPFWSKTVKLNTLISGSSQIIPWYENYFLGVIHYRVKLDILSKLKLKYFLKDPNYQQKKVRFRHQFIMLDKHFAIQSVSRNFVFESDEIEFCGGIARFEDGVYLSYGQQDSVAKVVRVDRTIVQGLMIN